MSATTTQRISLVLSRPLAGQVARALGSRAARTAKDAYDYLNNVRGQGASEAHAAVTAMSSLSALPERDLSAPTSAALAIASAAILDVSKGSGRRTAGERIEAAMDLLDDEFSAGL